jgi:hypothetical protein
MNVSHFHVYLSNQDKYSKLIFPRNKTLDFTVKLSKNLKLEGDWEVGVKSIILDQSWSTFETEIIPFWTIDNSTKNLFKFRHRALFKAKYYKSIIEILNDLNIICEKYFDYVKDKVTSDVEVVVNNDKSVSFPPKFGLKTSSNEVEASCGKVTYTLNKTTIEQLLCLRISKNICKILFGSSDFKDINKLDSIIGYHSQNINQFNLILQSDIVSFSLDGASEKQILRIFEQDFENREKFYTKSFDQIEYFPLIRKEISSIQISLSKLNGFLTEVKSGLLQLTLHFKRCE